MSATEQEVLKGQKAGVIRLTQPITGYKLMECKCKNEEGLWQQYMASLQIPSQATVVRQIGNKDSPAQLMRTDQYQINNLKLQTSSFSPCKFSSWFTKFSAPNLTNLECRSTRKPDLKYDVGPISHSQLDLSVDKHMVPGFQFQSYI
jgi:hypothetical protein